MCLLYALVYSLLYERNKPLLLKEKYRKKHWKEMKKMTLTKIVNSKLLAMLMGAWIAYCVGVGDYGGAVFLLFFYSLMLWDLHTKKATGAGNTDGKIQ